MKRRVNGFIPGQISSADIDSRRPQSVSIGLEAKLKTPLIGYKGGSSSPFGQIRSPDYDSAREPLVPLGLAQTTKSLQTSYGYSHNSLHPEKLYFSKSEYSEGPFYDDESEKFDLMDVTVVIYSLSGVMCEKEPENRQKSKFDNSEKLFGLRRDHNYGQISGSTISSFEQLATDDGALMNNVGAPTTAVVSYHKNTYSSQTSLETFLPSVPINNPMNSIGTKFRYHASWPSEHLAFTRDESAAARSSIKLTRCMRQEGYVPGTRIGSNYVHETLELRINLSRGTELLRLGTATLVISGDEEGEVQMLVPAKPFNQKKKLTRKRIRAKPNKYGFFSGDLSRRFFLDENSTLRVGIRVVPQETRLVVGDRERNENTFEQNWGSGDLKHFVQTMGNLSLRNGEVRENCNLESQASGTSLSTEEPENIFQNLFCGALCTTQSNQKCHRNIGDVPSVVHAVDIAQLGIDSLMSSVSESTDGSDYSDDDIQAEISKLRMTTAFRRFT